jgi:hypothetical protein
LGNEGIGAGGQSTGSAEPGNLRRPPLGGQNGGAAIATPQPL